MQLEIIFRIVGGLIRGKPKFSDISSILRKKKTCFYLTHEHVHKFEGSFARLFGFRFCGQSLFPRSIQLHLLENLNYVALACDVNSITVLFTLD